MNFNLFNWLFTDPQSAGSNAGLSGPEMFHFYLPWIVFCALGIVVTFYYSVEGRKRFFKSRPVLKYVLDSYLGWLSVICVIGLPLIFSRAYLDGYFFAWRVWRYLWLLALVFWAVKLTLYLSRKYPREKASYQAYQNNQKYIPKGSRRKTKAASSR